MSSTIQFVGIDAGGWRKDGTCQCWVARLVGHVFTLQEHRFETGKLFIPYLLEPDAAVVAVDAPQGLPYQNSRRREADRLANTPTSILPTRRHQLEPGTRQVNGKQFPMLNFVRFGCELFWENRRHLCKEQGRPCRLVETYPRAVLLRWAKKEDIPSKKKARRTYIEFVEKLLASRGYQWSADIQRPDYCDAMLCAIAARVHFEGQAEYIGLTYEVDRAEQIIREGQIVVPK